MPSTPLNGTHHTDRKQQRKVCFSFAAYAKAVIDHLRSCGVPVTSGLTELEFTAIETTNSFTFPPDLRSILREGLPVGSGFPNWRSSSPQQLRALLNLPISSLLNHVSNGKLWPDTWGPSPDKLEDRTAKARNVLDSSPRLVPIYQNFYIPSVKSDANGSPIFYVGGGGEVKCWRLDIADFFNRFDTKSTLPMLPAWAAKSARRVETWSDLAGEKSDYIEVWGEMEMRLRDGGWREEEVKEMLEMDGGDRMGTAAVVVMGRDKESVMWHVRLLALALLRGGWSKEDVVYAMGGSDYRLDQEITSEMVGKT